MKNEIIDLAPAELTPEETTRLREIEVLRANDPRAAGYRELGLELNDAMKLSSLENTKEHTELGSKELAEYQRLMRLKEYHSKVEK